MDTSSQYARCSDDGMPPPPRRFQRDDDGQGQESLLADSQMTQLDVDTVSQTQSVGHGGRGAPSVQDSSVPAGFFDEVKPYTPKGPIQEQRKEAFDAFMQELSALGAVENNQDDTIMEVTERPHQDDQDDQDDTLDTFEQFVREERMREIKEAVRQRNSAVFSEQGVGNSVLAEIGVVASHDNLMTSISLHPRDGQQQQSIAESYNELLHTSHHGKPSASAFSSSSSDEDEDDDDDDDDDGWRHKKLR